MTECRTDRELTAAWCAKKGHPRNMTCVAMRDGKRLCKAKVCYCEPCPECGAHWKIDP